MMSMNKFLKLITEMIQLDKNTIKYQKGQLIGI